MRTFLWGMVIGAFVATMMSGTRRRAPQLQNVERRFEVFTSDNQRVGHVDEVMPDQIVLWDAGPAGEDFRIPAQLIGSTSGRRVTLTISRDELNRQVPVRARRAA